ncbi:hypothetical protein JB92DRAFT_3120879 [Gautieria morchelliformis]|nr:hypothetical protein JB92DRAFT_3120879 [Gautieria morchelliformis]
MELSSEIETIHAEDVACCKEEFERKARRLRAQIQDATGRDISSFSASITNRIDILARTASALGVEDCSLSTYSAALSKLSSDRLQMHLHLIHLRNAERELREANGLARYRQELVATWPKPTDLEVEAASLERQRRAMATKAQEYQEELSTIASGMPSEPDNGQTITSLLAVQDRLHQKDRELKALKRRLSSFENLPPNLELAKLELKAARENQIRLMNTREKLLGRMTLGLS